MLCFVNKYVFNSFCMKKKQRAIITSILPKQARDYARNVFRGTF